jgi:hypothetical protein
MQFRWMHASRYTHSADAASIHASPYTHSVYAASMHASPYTHSVYAASMHASPYTHSAYAASMHASPYTLDRSKAAGWALSSRWTRPESRFGRVHTSRPAHGCDAHARVACTLECS